MSSLPRDDSVERLFASESFGARDSSTSGLLDSSSQGAHPLVGSGLAEGMMLESLSDSSLQGSALRATATEAQLHLAGRPPWYDTTGEVRRPLIIGVSGGSASGKTTVCTKIIQALRVRWVTILSQDSYYKNLTAEQIANVKAYNFDHPDAFDVDDMRVALQRLRAGRSVEVPIYDYVQHRRREETHTMYGADVVLFEGILILHYPELRALMDVKVFVDTDADIRLIRRLRRDTVERGRDYLGVLAQYERFVKPAFEQFIEPTKAFADIILPRGADNHVAIEMIKQIIQVKLRARGYRYRLERRRLLSGKHHSWQGSDTPANLHIIEQTRQVLAVQTVLRAHDTDADDFIFSADRLIRLLVEQAMLALPYRRTKTVTTPTGATYTGHTFDSNLCAVSILPAGASMEGGVRDVLMQVKIGKIMIQKVNGKPHLFYAKLPKDVSERTVLLLEPTVTTGQSTVMAIRVLLEHGVAAENIFLLSIFASRPGVSYVMDLFPDVHVVVTDVDAVVEEHKNAATGVVEYEMKPGCGSFERRYFHTLTDGESSSTLESEGDSGL